ncbi:hypothetical protein PR048_019172 [Dryococelus australis]|uniref:Uncharacterized protein n=1 Tax=Dryococelus australis TaxID=614101 RepID=A0ABQ9H2S8_9NEOP|nr:hypothetical protein PR048_019172 [Dryococelus australis]
MVILMRCRGSPVADPDLQKVMCFRETGQSLCARRKPGVSTSLPSYCSSATWYPASVAGSTTPSGCPTWTTTSRSTRHPSSSGRGGVVVRLLASHLGEPGSIPGFSHVQIVPGDAVGRRVSSGISRFQRPFFAVQIHSHLILPSSALTTSLVPKTTEVKQPPYTANSSFAPQQNVVTSQQIVGMLFTSQRLVSCSPAGGPANREPSAAIGANWRTGTHTSKELQRSFASVYLPIIANDVFTGNCNRLKDIGKSVGIMGIHGMFASWPAAGPNDRDTNTSSFSQNVSLIWWANHNTPWVLAIRISFSGKIDTKFWSSFILREMLEIFGEFGHKGIGKYEPGASRPSYGDVTKPQYWIHVTLTLTHHINLDPMARPLTHHRDPVSIPGQVTGFSHVGIVQDDAIGRRVYSGTSCFPDLSFWFHTSITLIGFQDLAVKSHPNLFTSLDLDPVTLNDLENKNSRKICKTQQAYDVTDYYHHVGCSANQIVCPIPGISSVIRWASSNARQISASAGIPSSSRSAIVCKTPNKALVAVVSNVSYRAKLSEYIAFPDGVFDKLLPSWMSLRESLSSTSKRQVEHFGALLAT